MKKPDRLFHSPGPWESAGPGGTTHHCHLIQGTPIGNLAIVYRAAPFIVYRILLPNAMPEQFGKTFPNIFSHHFPCPESTRIARCIHDYLGGDTASPGPPPWNLLYMEDLSPLQRRVLEATSDIPYGRTASYN